MLGNVPAIGSKINLHGRPTKLPQASYEGPLSGGGLALDCAVLEDGTRVITERKFMSAMDIKRSGYISTRRKAEEGGAVLPLFLSVPALKPYVDKHFGVVQEPRKFVTKAGVELHAGKLCPSVFRIPCYR